MELNGNKTRFSVSQSVHKSSFFKHISSCYSLIKVYGQGSVVLSFYFSKHNARKLYSVRQRLKNNEDVILLIRCTQIEAIARLRLSVVRFKYYKCYTGSSLVAK